MTFRFRRRGVTRTRNPLQADAVAIAEALEQTTRLYASDPDDFDLAIALSDLLDRAPTADLAALAASGASEDELYERELQPNWEGLDQGRRRAKIESFARFANAIESEDAGGVGPLVRTKLLILAWAYD